MVATERASSGANLPGGAAPARPDLSPLEDRLRAAIEAAEAESPGRVVLVLGPGQDQVAGVRALMDELRPRIATLVVDEIAPPTGNVEVRVLGPVEVDGVEGPLVRHPKLTELIVYLAMHPDGATTRVWSVALWPDRRVPQQTIANRLSEARHALGFASDDRPRMRRNGERHRIVETPTDWDVFRSLARRDDPTAWHAALELVRGRPFDGLQQGHWVVLEGFAAEIEEAVVTCALQYGTERLTAGDGEAAAWAAQRGLRANPFDERLHRLAMRAAAALGSRASLGESLQRLARILELEGDPLRGVHPETAALYVELAGDEEYPASS